MCSSPQSIANVYEAFRRGFARATTGCEFQRVIWWDDPGGKERGFGDCPFECEIRARIPIEPGDKEALPGCPTGWKEGTAAGMVRFEFAQKRPYDTGWAMGNALVESMFYKDLREMLESPGVGELTLKKYLEQLDRGKK